MHCQRKGRLLHVAQALVMVGLHEGDPCPPAATERHPDSAISDPLVLSIVGRLVLGSIEADFCKQGLIVQHVPRYS